METQLAAKPFQSGLVDVIVKDDHKYEVHHQGLVRSG
jgi:hypothetical protein